MQTIQRKEFIHKVVAGVVAGTFISLINACKKDEDEPQPVDFTLDISSPSNSALQNPGGSVISNSVIVINNNGSYIALSDICTHQSCALAYNSSTQKLNCPCHGSAFSTSGAVLNGPASTSLKQYSVSQNGNILHITG